jgi:serine/threonine protein kinase
MEAGQAPGEYPFRSEARISKRYTLGRVLGHGAFGTTYLAHDTLQGRTVVVKLIKPGGPTSVDLFQREVGITRALAHPNIISLLDSGVSETGELYLVTEYVQGEDLADVLRATGPLGEARSLAVAGGIAQGLRYIHARKFVHRDLKPSNILLIGWPSNPDFNNPKILDFGVAGLLIGGLTRAGMMFGTPLYMSPEQVMGEPQSPATDVYGLGLLLFEMLAGHPLWLRAERPELVFHAILTGDLPAEALAGISAHCAALIRGCLHRNPSERPSIDDVVSELRQLAARADSTTTALPTLRSASLKGVSLSDATQETYLPFWRRILPIPKLGVRRVSVWITLIAVLCLSVALFSIPSLRPRESAMLCVGLLVTGASLMTGFWLRGKLGQKSSATAQAYALAAGAKTRVNVTATIAIQLDDLVSNLRALDERILAGSVAMMLKEYDQATEAKDRQSALMNVVTLSEKLAQRLSPWYVRYKDVIASGVAVSGAISGLITAYNALSGPHKP